jgi:bifunctional DNA-binding transcriptional regulator/antitoxin component of YhaV-PrlF toxin-antitoxin module
MLTKANISINEKSRQIIIPMEIGKKLNLTKFDWLKVNILHDYIVLSLPEDEDEELICALIHEGVLIDPKIES